jgi:single-strand DNA-binding protein
MTTSAPTPTTTPDTSVTLVSGSLSSPAERRRLPSGDSLVTIELTSRCGPGPAESVPVVWLDAPAWADSLAAGDRVVVVGRVRRRFFQAGGTRASRTEVVAERVVPEGKRARVRSAVDLARRRVASLDDRPAAAN